MVFDDNFLCTPDFLTPVDGLGAAQQVDNLRGTSEHHTRQGRGVALCAGNAS
jgi:hypothetical protein